MCCSSWGHKELDKTERLNWTGIVNSLPLWDVGILKSFLQVLQARNIFLKHLHQVYDSAGRWPLHLPVWREGVQEPSITRSLCQRKGYLLICTHIPALFELQTEVPFFFFILESLVFLNQHLKTSKLYGGKIQGVKLNFSPSLSLNNYEINRWF